jgi:hypothetical protein
MNEDLCPKIWLTTLHKVTGLLFEHGVVVRDGNELVVTEPFGVSYVCQVWIACLAELPNHQWLVQLENTLNTIQSLQARATHVVLLEE